MSLSARGIGEMMLACKRFELNEVYCSATLGDVAPFKA